MTLYPSGQEIANLQQPNEPGAAWAVAELLGNIPLEVGADVLTVLGEGLKERGYDAFFRQATGLRVLYVRRSAS